MHGFRTAIKGLLLASAVLGNAALADVTIEPLTWNFIGLDSNNVNAGPNRFPVGARVCVRSAVRVLAAGRQGAHPLPFRRFALEGMPPRR